MCARLGYELEREEDYGRRQEEILRVKVRGQFWIPGVDSGCKASVVNGFYLKARDSLTPHCVFHTCPHSCIRGTLQPLRLCMAPSLLFLSPLPRHFQHTWTTLKSGFQTGHKYCFCTRLFQIFWNSNLNGPPVLLFTKSGHLTIQQFPTFPNFHFNYI